MTRSHLAAPLLVLLAALPFTASAQPVAPSPRSIYFGVTAGLTYGGEKLATATFTNGETASIRSGGLVQLGAGIGWQPADLPVALQATVSYHVDNVSARNGDLRFSRYPVEVLAYYTGVSNWRFGAGPRFVNEAKLVIDVPGTDMTTRFKNTVGGVAEIGYRIGRVGWVNARYTAENYTAKSVNGTAVNATAISGDHAGVNFIAFF